MKRKRSRLLASLAVGASALIAASARAQVCEDPSAVCGKCGGAGEDVTVEDAQGALAAALGDGDCLDGYGDADLDGVLSAADALPPLRHVAAGGASPACAAREPGRPKIVVRISTPDEGTFGADVTLRLPASAGDARAALPEPQRGECGPLPGETQDCLILAYSVEEEEDGSRLLRIGAATTMSFHSPTRAARNKGAVADATIELLGDAAPLDAEGRLAPPRFELVRVLLYGTDGGEIPDAAAVCAVSPPSSGAR